MVEISFRSPSRPHADSPDTPVSEVARQLESRFSVIRTFSEMYKSQIKNIIVQIALGRMERIVGEEKIRDLWREYIINEEHGIKTNAARERGNQSFVDSGDYFGSLIAIIDGV